MSVAKIYGRNVDHVVMPNFLVIGAAKAGTTSLYRYLEQHPQIYMSPLKEPKFFAFEGEQIDFRGPGDKDRISRLSITNLEDYAGLFRAVSDENAIGEGSTLYLYDSKAAERIKYHIPDTKLIAILRDPARRAYSNFVYMVGNGLEPLSDFAQALREEEGRISDNWMPTWHYRKRGFYFEQLRPYFDLFDRDKIKIYLYEDFRSDPSKVLKDIFEYLCVDDAFRPDTSTKHNESGVPRSKALHRFFMTQSSLKTAVRPLVSSKLRNRFANGLIGFNLKKPGPMLEEVRGQLVADYREDILKLQDFIQRDLSHWLDPHVEVRRN